jgi:hypothetical protein
MTEIPVACTLSAAQIQERERTVFTELRQHARRVTERGDGYAIELAPTDEAIAAATTLIQLERRCCPFLCFTLTVAPGGALVELALTGAPGARDLLARLAARVGPAGGS